ncbi:hypothetical protein bsdcttw_21100 [Anaerocolumna chitinilytica]|uniref:Uncharacterized protein n=1 Tax=Anaerocolumna chitinilytica TaxID=1727145 RepID=A0A7I8DL18_9FIRM|nr:hypothetical protein bsdcttw_21100 [Anaerocolumna chitinilytica]
MKYLIRFIILPLTGLSTAGNKDSCNPAAGHTHPQKALPKNKEKRKREAKVRKLPEIIPAAPPWIIR